MLHSIRAILVLLLLIKDDKKFSVSAIEKSDLYPYGLSAGDTKLTATKLGGENEDISSNEIKLNTNIKFYSNEYGAIYVRICFYFILSFKLCISQFRLQSKVLFECISNAGKRKWIGILPHRNSWIFQCRISISVSFDCCTLLRR